MNQFIVSTQGDGLKCSLLKSFTQAEIRHKLRSATTNVYYCDSHHMSHTLHTFVKLPIY